MNANTTRTLAVATALVVSFHAGQAGAQEYVCTSGDLQRTVQVAYESHSALLPCEVLYAKSGGQPESLWRAEYEEGYCERQAVGLIQKLSDAGWSCSTVGADDAPAVADAEPEAEPAPADDAAADADAEPEPDAAEDAAEEEATAP